MNESAFGNPQSAMGERLASQLAFLREIDRLKAIFRQTYLLDRSRKENDAEHSWHLAMYAAILSEYAAGQVDVARAIRMAMVHDLVEIDAGDVFIYDQAGREGQAERERAAAGRVFALLPADQAAELRALWDEYEARATDDARFAAALDRLQPLLHNYFTQGATWREHGVTAPQVIARNRHIADGAPRLWELAEALIRDAVARGHLAAE